MSSTLTRQDVLRIAELARLDLTDAEVDRFTPQLGEILGYAQQIQEIDTSGVAPMSHAGASEAAWRDDEPRPCLGVDVALANAPDADTRAGLFKVPKVL
jgi:aspartyl-tRNA(Asn)/glutamyl-tRNA(Gln) amidotransferase subunit C